MRLRLLWLEKVFDVVSRVILAIVFLVLILVIYVGLISFVLLSPIIYLILSGLSLFSKRVRLNLSGFFPFHVGGALDWMWVFPDLMIIELGLRRPKYRGYQ
jgi:hypothetical protein